MPEEDQILENLLNDRPLDGEQVKQPESVSEENKDSQNSNQAAAPVTDADQNKNQQQDQSGNGQSEPSAENWISRASKIAGVEFKSEEEVTSYFERAKNYDDLQSKFNNLSQEHDSLKGQPDPFANDYVKKLNDFYKQGRTTEEIAAFNRINNLGELKDLEPLEAVKLALQLRDGLTPEEAEIKIKTDYKLDEEAYEKDIVDANRITLKLNAKKDLEFLQQFKAELSENKAEKSKEEAEKEFQKQIAEYTEKVKPIAKSIQDNFSVIKSVNINGKTGEEAHLIDIPVPEDLQKNLSELAETFAVQHNIPLNEEGLKVLNEYVENVIWIKNRQNIAIHIASETERRVRTEFDNPASISRGQDNPADTSAVKAKELEDWVLDNS